MNKFAPHNRDQRSSRKCLLFRVSYIADPNHRNHINKIILPSKNHNCPGQADADFIGAVERGYEKYLQRRSGKMGKRTKCLWREPIYSSPNGTIPKQDGTGMVPCLNAEEREKVEVAFLAGPFGRGPCRHAWHIDPVTGRCDWHCLCAEYDLEGIVWINSGFGTGQKNLKLELERIEEDLLAKLNRQRPPDRQLMTARQRHREKRRKAGKLTFAEKLAAGKWDGTPEKLTEAAELAGYVVHQQTEKSITVHSFEFKKGPKVIAYNVSTLTRNWSTAKAKLRSKKKQKPGDPDVTQPEL